MSYSYYNTVPLVRVKLAIPQSQVKQSTTKTLCSSQIKTEQEKCDTPGNQLYYQYVLKGAQWLSGRVLDSRPRGHRFEPHRRHCSVVLEQDTFILAKYWFNPGRTNMSLKLESRSSILN